MAVAEVRRSQGGGYGRGFEFRVGEREHGGAVVGGEGEAEEPF